MDVAPASLRQNNSVALTYQDLLSGMDLHLTYEGFCEDLARQSTVAHLFQRQLGFRRRHTWVSVWSHMGFSHRRSVLKTTI